MSSENQEVATRTRFGTLSGETPVTPETVSTDWKASLSDEVRADKSLENIKDIESLAKSYVHAQKMVGADKIPVPNKFATEKDWDAVYEKLGRPKTADEYKFESQDVNQDGLKSFATAAHKMGLLPNQANEMVKWYQENVAAETNAKNATAEKARTDAVSDLKKEYGLAYDQKLKAASSMAKQYVAAEVLDAPMADGSKLGDNPAIIKAFATLAEKMGEDQFVNPSGPTFLTPQAIDKQIGDLTAPNSAYWDKMHPNHEAAVEEVLALREQKESV
jgi:hypothetical protein